MLEKAKNIFIIGIKGAAMSNLALILKEMGKNVIGTDVEEEFITDELLKQYKIQVLIGFDETVLPSIADLIIYSAGHNGASNPLAQEGKKRGIPVLSQAEILGELLNYFKTSIAVAGCHGKTTTSALLANSLKNLGKNPSYLIGVPFFNGLPGGQLDKKDYFVIEADEYGVAPPVDKTPKLLYLHPTHIICTNIDFDHPDVYRDINQIKETFLTFFKDKKLFLCADDPQIQSVLPRLQKAQYETFGFSSKADLQIINPEVEENHSAFSLVYKGTDLGIFSISLFGEKNISNTAGVVLALLNLGFESEDIKKSIRDFSNIKRRFEFVFKDNDTYLFDDYGHHPHEIEATIESVRARFKNRRIVVLFQPHTYSRTQALLKEFAFSLSKADVGLIAPIFPSARENSEAFTVSSFDIEKQALSDNIKAFTDKKSMLLYLKKIIRKKDIIFTVGAGDIYKLKNDIIKIISHILK